MPYFAPIPETLATGRNWQTEAGTWTAQEHCAIPGVSLQSLGVFNKGADAYLLLYDSYTNATPGTKTGVVGSDGDNVLYVETPDATWTTGTKVRMDDGAVSFYLRVIPEGTGQTYTVHPTLADALAGTNTVILLPASYTLHVLDWIETILGPVYQNGDRSFGFGEGGWRRGLRFEGGILAMLSTTNTTPTPSAHARFVGRVIQY